MPRALKKGFYIRRKGIPPTILYNIKKNCLSVLEAFAEPEGFHSVRRLISRSSPSGPAADSGASRPLSAASPPGHAYDDRHPTAPPSPPTLLPSPSPSLL